MLMILEISLLFVNQMDQFCSAAVKPCNVHINAYSCKPASGGLNTIFSNDSILELCADSFTLTKMSSTIPITGECLNIAGSGSSGPLFRGP
jgi:hypothetical protein